MLHFVRPRPYEQMMPPWIPLHGEAVLVSGVGEVVGGAALLDRRTARFGFWWLTALLIAVFPANVYMATDPEKIPWVAKSNLPRGSALGPAAAPAPDGGAAGAGDPPDLRSARRQRPSRLSS